jgi:hypothetical protein
MFDRVTCSAMALLEVVVGAVDASGQAPILQQYAVTPYDVAFWPISLAVDPSPNAVRCQ